MSRLPGQLRSGHQLLLLQNGAEFFPALVEAMDAARQVVHLETYIFEFAGEALRVAEALERAARRGVAVRLVMPSGKDCIPTCTSAGRLSRSQKSSLLLIIVRISNNLVVMFLTELPADGRAVVRGVAYLLGVGDHIERRVDHRRDAAQQAGGLRLCGGQFGRQGGGALQRLAQADQFAWLDLAQREPRGNGLK